MQLDEYVTLHVRAQNDSEARGRATEYASKLMGGRFAAFVEGMEEARREPEFSDLYAVNVYPAPERL